MNERRVLGMACADLAGLRALAGHRGLGSNLEQAIEDIIAQGPKASNRFIHLLLDLGVQLDQTGLDSSEGEVQDIGDSLRGGDGLVGLPGIGPGHVADAVYMCPTGTCERVVRREVAEPVPFCEIYERVLAVR